VPRSAASSRRSGTEAAAEPTRAPASAKCPGRMLIFRVGAAEVLTLRNLRAWPFSSGLRDGIRRGGGGGEAVYRSLRYAAISVIARQDASASPYLSLARRVFAGKSRELSRLGHQSSAICARVGVGRFRGRGQACGLWVNLREGGRVEGRDRWRERWSVGLA
jgi:hypothetical protein